jgi:hypothetical protein
MDVSTVDCKFAEEPVYHVSIVSHAPSLMTGSHTIVNDNIENTLGFRLMVTHPYMQADKLWQHAMEHRWYASWMGTTGRHTGITASGATLWRKYSSHIFFTDVDTAAAGFRATPVYFTSLYGAARQWSTTGVHVISNPLMNSFRVYLHSSSKITPAQANKHKLTVAWSGVDDPVNCGQSHSWTRAKVNHNWEAHVDTLHSGHEGSVTYVTAMAGGTAFDVMSFYGAGTLFDPSAGGFSMYLDQFSDHQLSGKRCHVRKPLSDKSLDCGDKWAVNYCGHSATDCELFQWHSWSACSKSCGTGEQHRVRLIDSPVEVVVKLVKVKDPKTGMTTLNSKRVMQKRKSKCPADPSLPLVQTRKCSTKCCGPCRKCTPAAPKPPAHLHSLVMFRSSNPISDQCADASANGIADASR